MLASSGKRNRTSNLRETCWPARTFAIAAGKRNRICNWGVIFWPPEEAQPQLQLGVDRVCVLLCVPAPPGGCSGEPPALHAATLHYLFKHFSFAFSVFKQVADTRSASVPSDRQIGAGR